MFNLDKYLDENKFIFENNFTRTTWLYNNVFENKIYDLISDEQWWKLLIEVWEFCEVNSASRDRLLWFDLLQARDPIEIFKKGIPRGKFKIYRAGNFDGYSWSLEHKIAKRFKLLSKSRDKRDVEIHEKIISDDQVLFYTNTRKEKEVVILIEDPSSFVFD